jgi:hypothetical protein
MERIAASGNTEVPAYLTLRQAGFEVVATPVENENERWIATKPDITLIAESPLELLGLWFMRKERGADCDRGPAFGPKRVSGSGLSLQGNRGVVGFKLLAEGARRAIGAKSFQAGLGWRTVADAAVGAFLVVV